MGEVLRPTRPEVNIYCKLELFLLEVLSIFAVTCRDFF